MINKPTIGGNTAKHVSNDSKASPESKLHHLAAASLVGGWIEKVREPKGERCVSANELTSLSALIVYVAQKSGMSEFRIERNLADRFHIANAKCLPTLRYDEAVRYLVDLVSEFSGD